MADAYDPLDYDNLAKSVVDSLLAATPVALPPQPFNGSGVYALYYTGSLDFYRPIASSECNVPIYVGKADARSTRRGDEVTPAAGKTLHNRLKKHAKSIKSAVNLEIVEFRCRYLVVAPVWVSLAEQFLLNRFRPVWNTVADGFGNNPPGRGRDKMRRPRWDVVHPRREWAQGLNPKETPDQVQAQIAEALKPSVQMPSHR